MDSKRIDRWEAANRAELEAHDALRRQRQREVASAALEAAVAQGIHRSAIVPVGYDRDAKGRLVPNEWAPVITEAFKLRAKGATWPEVALLLIQKGVPTGRGGDWTADAARRVLTNRVYLGEARAGVHVKTRAHKALTTKRIFEASQSRGPQFSSAASFGPSLLAGLLRCAGCRYLMKPDTMTLGGERVRNYRCRGHHGGGVCTDRATSLASVIEPEVVEHLMAFITQVKQTGAHDAAVDEVQAAEKELMVFQTDPFVISTLGIEGLRAGIEARQLRVATARAELARIPVTEMGQRGLRAHWNDMTIEQQRTLLASAYGAIFLRSTAHGSDDISTRLLYLGVGDVPPDLPGRRGPVETVRPLAWDVVSRKAIRRF